MQKALATINGYSQSSGGIHFYKRMKEELAKFSIDLVLRKATDILATTDENGNASVKLDGEYLFGLFLDKDLYLSLLMEKSGLRLFNNAEAIRLCDDKMLTHIILADNGIKMPKTISAPLNYSNEFNGDFIGLLENSLNYPMVAKSNYGSLGKRVFLISNHDELTSFEKEHSKEAHLYQELIESSYGFDYRLIIVGNKFIAGMKRINDYGDFRSNIALGGRGEVVDIPTDYIKMAEDASKVLGLDYCGVDILGGKNDEPILCEVNSNAYIEGIEKTTGINVAREYANYLISSILQRR